MDVVVLRYTPEGWTDGEDHWESLTDALTDMAFEVAAETCVLIGTLKADATKGSTDGN